MLPTCFLALPSSLDPRHVSLLLESMFTHVENWDPEKLMRHSPSVREPRTPLHFISHLCWYEPWRWHRDSP